MKTLSKLGVTPTKPFICSVGTKAGVGKTTILSILAADLANENKDVLFITEDTPTLLMRRLRNLVNMGKTNSKLIVMYNAVPDRSITNMINGRKFDYIFVDTPSILDVNKIAEIRTLVNTVDGVFISHQLKTTFGTKTDEIFGLHPSQSVQISDYVIIANKKTEISLLDRLKKLVFIKTPNITLNLLKNRHGKDGVKKHIVVDFEKINNHGIN